MKARKHLAAIGIQHLISHIVGYRSSLYPYGDYMISDSGNQYLIHISMIFYPIHSISTAKMRVVLPSTTSFSMHLADKLQASSKRSLGIQIPGVYAHGKPAGISSDYRKIPSLCITVHICHIYTIYIYIYIH